MSIPERLYKISKAYLGQVRDRIDSELAERELEASLREEGGPDREDASSDAMMRRAEERIAAMRREIDARNTANGASGAATATVPAATTAAPTTAGDNALTTEADPNAKDFRVMGVPVGSDLAAVQAAYETLALRCDPRRFPDGSTEQREAQRILSKVNASYEALKSRLDPMQNRFGKLELE